MTKFQRIEEAEYKWFLMLLDNVDHMNKNTLQTLVECWDYIDSLKSMNRC